MNPFTHPTIAEPTMDTPVRPIPNIPLTPVDSSQIAAIGHDPETNTLAIQFKNKSGLSDPYYYANFPAEKFEEFRKADSLGSFFGKNIKHATDVHPFTKIVQDDTAKA